MLITYSIIISIIIGSLIVVAIKVSGKNEEKEYDALLADRMEMFKEHYFEAGAVTATIKNYQWTELNIQGSGLVYDSFERFIETEYRKNHRLTSHEYYHLRITEEALELCREKAGIKAPHTQDPIHTVIETADYGRLVSYQADQLLPIGKKGKMAALLTKDAEDQLFIREVHIFSGAGALKVDGKQAVSVSIYPIAMKDGNRDVKWTNAFQVNIESDKAKWEEELSRLAQLKGELSHWNKHRDLVSFDNVRGYWLVQPKLPHEEAAASTETEKPQVTPVAPIIQGVPEEEVIKWVEEVEQKKNAEIDELKALVLEQSRIMKQMQSLLKEEN